MTPDTLISILKMRMANSNDSDLDTKIITLSSVVQERLEQAPELPWFLFKDTNVEGTNFDTTAATETVALPSDFIREDDENDYVLFVYDSSETDPWVPLEKRDYAKIKTEIRTTGRPGYYDILGSNLYLRKTPDDVYTLRLLYYGKDSGIAAGGSANLWLTHASDWFMAELGHMLTSTVVPMPALAQTFAGEMIIAKSRVMNETIARREAGMMREMGDE